MPKKSQISDAELKALLGAQREEVAVPASFRASLMDRLAKEHGWAKTEIEAPSLFDRVASFIFRPALVPALTLAGLALVFFSVIRHDAPPPQHTASLAAQVPAPAGDPVRAGASGSAQVLAQKPPSPAIVSGREHAALPPAVAQAPAPAPSVRKLSEEAKAQLLAEAKAAQAAARVESAPQLSSGAAPAAGNIGGVVAAGEAKPTFVVVTPQPTPIANMFSGFSQVRRNKFRPSQGEDCVILINQKAGSQVKVLVFDRLGAEKARLLDQYKGAGVIELRWPGFDDKGRMLASGIYLIRIETPLFSSVHKVMLVR